MTTDLLDNPDGENPQDFHGLKESIIKESIDPLLDKILDLRARIRRTEDLEELSNLLRKDGNDIKSDITKFQKVKKE